MKKVIKVLFLAAVVLGLAACGGNAENQDVQTQPASIEQGVREVTGNDAGIDANMGSQTHNSDFGRIISGTVPTSEILAGTVQAIDGMRLSVDTSSVFVAMGTGPHTVSPGEEPEPHEEIVSITEQTVIEIQTLADGQVLGAVAGTLDDISLQAVIMAEGEWQDGEFVATKLTIMNF